MQLILLSFFFAAFLAWLFPFGKMPPIINDVATDLEDPPQFVKAEIGPLPERFKAIIKEHYPDLKPAVFAEHERGRVFDAVVKTVQEQPRWSVTYQDAASGVLEGVAVTRVMRFRDDFVIRVRDHPQGGSVVDMRSRSRLGKGDMGANAERIRIFLKALSETLPQLKAT